MPVSLRARRIKQNYERAAKTENILWINRRNAFWALLCIGRLGEKTQLKCQKLIDQMRAQYTDLDTQREIDELQEKLNRQRDAMKRRLAKVDAEPKNNKRTKIEEKPDPKPPTPTVLSNGEPFDPFAI